MVTKEEVEKARADYYDGKAAVAEHAIAGKAAAWKALYAAWKKYKKLKKEYANALLVES